MKLKLEHGTSNASGVTLACPGRCNLAVTGSSRLHPGTRSTQHPRTSSSSPAPSKSSPPTGFPSPGPWGWKGGRHPQVLAWGGDGAHHTERPRTRRRVGIRTDGAPGEQSRSWHSPQSVQAGPLGGAGISSCAPVVWGRAGTTFLLPRQNLGPKAATGPGQVW